MDRPLVILHGEIRTPPLSDEARRWAGFLLRKLQHGELVTLPDSRPMPVIGPRCHELRFRDTEKKLNWRIVYRLDPDALLIADVFPKKTRTTPLEVIRRCQVRLARYDELRSPP